MLPQQRVPSPRTLDPMHSMTRQHLRPERRWYLTPACSRGRRHRQSLLHVACDGSHRPHRALPWSGMLPACRVHSNARQSLQLVMMSVRLSGLAIAIRKSEYSVCHSSQAWSWSTLDRAVRKVGLSKPDQAKESREGQEDFNGTRRICTRIGLSNELGHRKSRKSEEKVQKKEKGWIFTKKPMFLVETTHTSFILAESHLCFLEIMVFSVCNLSKNFQFLQQFSE